MIIQTEFQLAYSVPSNNTIRNGGIELLTADTVDTVYRVRGTGAGGG